MSTAGSNSGSFIIHGVESTGKEIGRGAYGRVFEVNFEGTLCAAKEIHTILLQHAQGEELRKIREDFLRECQVWTTLRHPCIVQFIGKWYNDSACQLEVPTLLINFIMAGYQLFLYYGKIP